MALLGDILNLITCGASEVLGTGTKGCKIFFKKTTALWLTPTGFKYDSTQEFDDTYIKLLQAEGNLIIVKGIRTFADNSSDDTMDELEDGTKQVAKLGLYEFAAEFINGLYFHAALHSLNSFGNHDVAFVDRDGNILGTKASDGSFKGMSAGYIQAARLKWATDSTGQREGLGLQLLERSEIDNDYIIIQRKQLDYNPNSLDGVNEVLVSYSAVPADAATAITVKAVLKQDGSAFSGLPFANWLHKIDGVTSAVTAGDDTTTAGTYPLTVPALAAGEVSTIELADGNKEVVTLDSELYKSNTPSSVVV